MFNPFMLYTAYARVRALSVKRCAEHKQRNRDRRQEFSEISFSYDLSFVRFRSWKLRRMFAAANSKRFEKLLRDPACFLQLA